MSVALFETLKTGFVMQGPNEPAALVILVSAPDCVCTDVMPRSHIHGLDAGLATNVHSWQSVLVRSFPYCIRNHT